MRRGIATLQVELGPWSGRAWRFHGRRYAADDHGGSLRVTGRYHRGSDRFPDEETWPALYLALAPEVALGERLRHLSAETLGTLRSQRLTELDVRLGAVIDWRSLAGVGMSLDELCAPDYARTHELALAARRTGAEGMLLPSCTRLPPGVLVVFPDLLRPDSVVTIVGSVDPALTIP